MDQNGDRLLSRYEYLAAERDRRTKSLPQKLLAVFAVLLSLVGVGASAGIASTWFIVAASIVGLVLFPVAINSIAFQLNLRAAQSNVIVLKR